MDALTLARSFERRRDRLDDRRELARGERDERHARAIGVAGAARTVAITVERRSVGAFEAVVLADDPFLHEASLPTGSCALCVRRVYPWDLCLRRGFSHITGGFSVL